MRRILYILEPFSIPYGGVATIYHHVEILHRHGVPAWIAISKQPIRDFYDTKAPTILHGGRLDQLVNADDILVIPEGFEAHLHGLAATPAERIMFCQNHLYLPFSQDPHAGIAEFKVDSVIASSQSIRTFFQDVYHLPNVPVLPYAIDPQRYKPSDRKRRQVAYMPRKMANEAAFIQAVFRRRYSRHAMVPWVPIHDMTQMEAAQVLAMSDVFLSLSNRESFGLPPLEAMACGCLVAGFHGGGGLEYMTVENGWWAETGDWKYATDGLAAALDLLDLAGPPLDALRRAIATTVGRYSPERQQSEVLSFWRRKLHVL